MNVQWKHPQPKPGATMPDTMKALPTPYRGITYRSRTEARWAAFFDEMAIDAVYEGEGYDLDGVWYLPDFWLPGPKIWIEVKGTEPTVDEIQKAENLAKRSGRLVLIAIGHPTTDPEAFNLIAWGGRIFDPESGGTRVRFADEGKRLIVISGRNYGVVAEISGNESDLGGSPVPQECLRAARTVQNLRFGVHE